MDTDKFLALRDFLAKLKATKEEGETLLDRTMVLVGSHMHSGGHRVNNLPILLAGGKYQCTNMLVNSRVESVWNARCIRS